MPTAAVLSRYREIEVNGSPRDMGRQIGEAAGEEIRGFCEVALARVNRTMRVSRGAARAVVAESMGLAEDYSADSMNELRGMAEAAGVSLEDVMLLQVRNQLQAEPEAGCTSLALSPTAGAGGIVAQNWDNDVALDAFNIVLTRRPAGKPALTTITQAGLISYIGFNDAGVGLCLNTLPAPARTRGVPHYFTVRGIYESSSLDGAVAAVSRAERAIPANILLSTPEGPADLEVTMENVHVLTDAGPGRITHTNHCLHPELVGINNDFPELIESHPRKSRIDALLKSNGEGSSPMEAVKAALRDHDNHPRSICRHQNDDETTGFWQTVFSVIIEPQERRMHITRGTPCDREYETYSMP